MPEIVTMGHSLKTNINTVKNRMETGYTDDDKPVLESFGLFKDGKPVPDFILSKEEYADFLNWLGNGPAKPIPSIGIKVLCFYKHKLNMGMKDFTITDGFRQKQKNLIKSIDEMLKDGDDTQSAGAVCAKGGSSSDTTTTSTTDCCSEIKADILAIKTLLTEIQTQTHKTGDSKNTVSDNGSEEVRAVAQMVQHVDEKTTHVLTEIQKVREDVQSILTKSGANTENALSGLQADYDEAQRDAETARIRAEGATTTLTQILENDSSSPADIQAAIEEAIEAKSEVEKYIAVANYIYKLDASSSSSSASASANVPVPPSIVESNTSIPIAPVVGGRRVQKMAMNEVKLSQAESKLDELDATIATAMKKLLTISGTNTTTDKNSIIEGLSKNLMSKNTKLSQMTNSITSLTKIIKDLAELQQKAKNVPNTTNIKSKLDEANRRIEELEKLKDTDEDFQKMKLALESDIENLRKNIDAKTLKMSQMTNSITSLTEIIKDLAELQQKVKNVPNTTNIKSKLDEANRRIEELERTTHSDEDFKQMKSELESQIEILKMTIDEKIELYDKAMEDINTLKQKIEQTEIENTNLERKLNDKMAQLTKMENEIEEINKLLKVTTDILENSQDNNIDKETLFSKIAKLTEEFRKKSASYEALLSEHKITLDDLTASRSEIATLREEIAKKLTQGQSDALADLQERYDDTLREMHRAHEELYNTKETIKTLQQKLVEAEQLQVDTEDLQKQIKLKTEEMTQMEEKYKNEKAELENSEKQCEVVHREIREQLERSESELAKLQVIISNKETEMQELNKKGLTVNSGKEQELVELRKTVQFLTAKVASCDKTAQQSELYLREIENLKRKLAPYEPNKNTRFNLNFPGLAQTKRKNTSNINLRKTLKTPKQPNTGSKIRSAINMEENRKSLADRLGQQYPTVNKTLKPPSDANTGSKIRSAINMEENRKSLADRLGQQYPTVNKTLKTPSQTNARFNKNFPGMTHEKRTTPRTTPRTQQPLTQQPFQPNVRFNKNFPGMNQLRSEDKGKLRRINKERQELQKVRPHTNLQSFQKRGGLKKGARLAKSKKNIHPLN